MQEKNEKRIVAVALKLQNGTIVSRSKPARHPSLFLDCQTHGEDPHAAVQGFLDNEGKFLTREEAKIVANEADQLLPIDGIPGERRLFSEDIW